MGVRKIRMRYGRGEVAFNLPDDQIFFEVIGKEYPAIANIPDAIRAALERPIDSPPLRELLHPTDKVVITVSDIATFIMVIRPENNELVRKAGVLPVATMEEDIEQAYRRCGTKAPRITLMPQGANTLPVL